MTLQGGDCRKKHLLGDQPCGRAIKQHTGPICSRPAEGIKPTIQPELYDVIAKLAKAAVPADFRGMVPARFAVAVINETAQLLNSELSSQIVHCALRHICQVVEKSAEKSCRAELYSKTEAGVIAAMGVDHFPIALVQEEIACQLLLRRLAGEPGVTRALLVGEETDGHRPPFRSGEGVAKLTSFAKKPKPQFFAGISFAKVCSKRYLLCKDFCNTIDENRLRARFHTGSESGPSVEGSEEGRMSKDLPREDLRCQPQSAGISENAGSASRRRHNRCLEARSAGALHS